MEKLIEINMQAKTPLMRSLGLGLSLLLSLSAVCQQQGWWTWMKGATYPTSGAGVYGTLGVPNAANTPPSMYQSAACWTDNQGNFWQLGGGNATFSQALFKYNPATNEWTWVHGPQALGGGGVWGTKGVAAPANIPSSRGMGIATWVDAQNNLWLFGGNAVGSAGGPTKGWMADLWKYDPVTNMWTWMSGPSLMNQPGVYGTQGVPSVNNYPPGRYECNTTWVDNSGNFWLFGGGSQNGTRNDLWRYNPTTNEWTWMKGSNAAGNVGNYGTKGVAAATNNPPARWGYCRWKDNSGRFWLFGGTHVSNTQSMNDMWMYDPATNNWTWMSGSNLKDQLPAFPVKCVPSTTNYPQARYENPIAWKDICGNLWMFGGHWAPGLSVPDVNDIWCYKVQTNEWVFVGGNISAANGVSGTQGVPAATNIPPSTYSSAAWSSGNAFYFFGGRAGAGSSDVNTLWRYYPDTTCAQSTCFVANPVAGFTATNLSGCAPLTVTFTNTSTQSTNWSWNFGDGGTSTSQNPTHTYTAAGTYTVSLIAYNGANSDTMIQPNYVTVFPSAAAAFTASNDTVCIGQNVTFTNSSTNASSYNWNFGNGNTSTSPNPTSSYSATGNYTVTLIALNANGCNDTIAQPITVLSNSVTSSFTQSTGTCAPVTINFTNSSSGATSYQWNFGNGNTSALQNPSSTYTAAGTYTISLISSANSICGIAADTSYSTLTIGQAPTITVSSQTNVSCFGGNNGSATASASGGSLPYSYSWNNGATTSQISNLTSQVYSVTITDALGCSSTQSVSITQPTALNATAGSTPSGCNQQNGTASVSVSGGTAPYSYAWSNGGSSSQISNLSSQVYSVTITDANGCTSVQTTNVGSSGGPTASAGTSVSIQAGSSATLSASGGVSYSWSPASGLDNASSMNPVASPSTTVQYCVFVFDANNCYDSACLTIYVIPEPIDCGTFYLPNAFSPNDDGDNDDYRAYVNPACVEEYKLKIYNRWGELVFYTEDILEGWNGVFRDVVSNPAVYAVHCRIKLINGKAQTIKKNVSLVR